MAFLREAAGRICVGIWHRSLMDLGLICHSDINTFLFAIIAHSGYKFKLRLRRMIHSFVCGRACPGHPRFAAHVVRVSVDTRHKSLSSGRAQRGPVGRARTIKGGLNHLNASKHQRAADATATSAPCRSAGIAFRPIGGNAKALRVEKPGLHLNPRRHR